MVPEDAFLFVDHAPDAIVVVDSDGVIVYTNRQAVLLFGYETVELIGQGIELLIPDAAREEHVTARSAYAAEPWTRPMGGPAARVEARCKDGRLLPVEVSLSPVDISGGRVTMAAVRDVTERVRVEDERDRFRTSVARDRQQQARVVAALAGIRQEALHDGPVSEALKVVSETANSLVGGTRALIAVEVEGSFRSVAMSGAPGAAMPTSVLHDAVSLASTLESGDSTELVGEELAASGLKAGFGDVEVERVLLAPLAASGSVEGFLAVASAGSGFTDAQRSAAWALASEAAVTLALDRAKGDKQRRLVAEDRQRIARDLHDLVIQRIFASGMTLQAAVQSSSARTENDMLGNNVSDVIGELDETIAVIRNAIFELNQSGSQIAAEVDATCQRCRDRSGLAVDLTIDGDVSQIADDASSQIVPTLNELLSNVQRHAHAENVSVLVSVGDENLEVVVTDDGVGLDPPLRQGLGLRNLTDRAESLGGFVDHGPAHPVGSAVRWVVPVMGHSD